MAHNKRFKEELSWDTWPLVGGETRLPYMLSAIPIPEEFRNSPRVFSISRDLFHVKVPFGFIAAAFDQMHKYPCHTYLCLTKRPNLVGKFINQYRRNTPNSWPPTLIIGASVPDNSKRKRIRDLQANTVLAHNRILSLEPMLGPVDLPDCLSDLHSPINGIICGCQRGPGRVIPEIAWLESLVQQCTDSNTPFFLKQWDFGKGVEMRPEYNGRTWSELPGVDNKETRLVVANDG